ncbi:hypothetical protein AVEN_168895-1 [Araneus ventricosus]|uniref:Transposon Ty3-I Gag-Pol polyprotein n=1 Tax=Araneus ventricosus TaxID=182803 RepID=A0A4Y2PAR5_ARAVE|nr:hypothetical protein AVEN_168895-1 [Araneus ventricosus]
MSFLAKARKCDLEILATELGAQVERNMKVIDLKELITTHKNYEETFVKDMLDTIMTEKAEKKTKELELEKLRTQVKNDLATSNPTTQYKPKLDLLTLVPKFDASQNDISLYLVLFERKYESTFHLGGEATPYVEHYTNTGDNPPVSVPLCRKSPAKKKLLRKELDDLLEKGFIEECESPYAALVVLVPKPNGTVSLCVDYRKLNANTIPDACPLSRMDDVPDSNFSLQQTCTANLQAYSKFDTTRVQV